SPSEHPTKCGLSAKRKDGFSAAVYLRSASCEESMMRAARSPALKSSGDARPRISSLLFSAFSTIATAPDQRPRPTTSDCDRPKLRPLPLVPPAIAGHMFRPSACSRRLPPSAGGNTACRGRARVKEESLAHHRLHHVRGKRLGDQEGGFGTIAGEQALGISRDEDDRYFEAAEEIVHGIDSRAAVGELDVGEDDSGFAAVSELARLFASPG